MDGVAKDAPAGSGARDDQHAAVTQVASRELRRKPELAARRGAAGADTRRRPRPLPVLRAHQRSIANGRRRLRHPRWRRDGSFKQVLALTLSNDGRRSAYAVAASGGEFWRTRLDGAFVGHAYERAFPPVFSPAGTGVAWTGIHDDKAYLVVDGPEIARVDEVLRAPLLGDDGTVTAVVRRGQRVTRPRFAP